MENKVIFIKFVPFGKNSGIYVMKSIITISLSVLLLAFAASSSAAAFPVAEGLTTFSTEKPRKELKEVTFSVSMHCGNCVKKITENISFEKGVKDLEVSLEDRTVRVKYDASKTDSATLAKAIEKLGYEVREL